MQMLVKDFKKRERERKEQLKMWTVSKNIRMKTKGHLIIVSREQQRGSGGNAAWEQVTQVMWGTGRESSNLGGVGT